MAFSRESTGHPPGRDVHIILKAFDREIYGDDPGKGIMVMPDYWRKLSKQFREFLRLNRICVDGDEWEWDESTIEQAWLALTYYREEKTKKKKHHDIGLLYKKIGDGWCHVVPDIGKPMTIEVGNTLRERNSVIRIHRLDPKEYGELMRVSTDLGIALVGAPSSRGGNKGTADGELGIMPVLGVSHFTYEQNPVLYATTKRPGIIDKMRSYLHIANREFATYFPAEVGEIRRHNKKYLGRLKYLNEKSVDGNFYDELGAGSAFSLALVVSINLGNSSHFDVNDATPSVALWVERFPGTAKNWYLLFPTTELDGKLGIAIKLHHGTMISWDGQFNRHCTAVTDVGVSEDGKPNDCISLFHGSNVKRKETR